MKIEDKIQELKSLITRFNERGMSGMAGSYWPVIVKQYNVEKISYEYEYPKEYFRNLQYQYGMYMPYDNKGDRVPIINFLIESLMNKEIDLHLYHFGLYLVYGDYRDRKMDEDFLPVAIGKRRAEYVESLPRSRFVSNDDFFTELYSLLMKRRDLDVGEYRQNPVLSEVRMLFAPEKIGAYGWPTYYNADWIEPLSGAMDLECKRWEGEHDPMAPLKLPDGWIEGNIVLGHEGSNSGLRHFVNGIPLHAGSAIQVKFGSGWIKGRYEWNFSQEGPIQIHSGEDVFYINENQIVRIRD